MRIYEYVKQLYYYVGEGSVIRLMCYVTRYAIHQNIYRYNIIIIYYVTNIILLYDMYILSIYNFVYFANKMDINRL